VFRIRSIHLGKVLPFGPRGHASAIAKIAVPGPVQVTRLGLVGDEQADRKHHGGPERAVHHYPLEHYEAWRLACPDQLDRFAAAGAFGENLSTAGGTEQTICVGDVYRVGGARLQVSQARQPCWKLDVRFGVDGMALRVQERGRTGWYYRVLDEGPVGVGDELELVERPQPDWPLSRLIHHLYADPLDDRANEALANLAELSPGWRRLFARRFESKAVEDSRGRLTVP
jgi:MOSC domain-containing protein YiiM